MDFLSPAFAFFVLATCAGFHLTTRVDIRFAVLLGSSIAFVASFFPNLHSAWPLALYVGLTLASAQIAVRLTRLMRTVFCYGSVVILLALLVWLLIRKSHQHDTNATLITVGLSYIFFRALQLLSDIAEGTLASDDLSTPQLLLFLISFLTFAAGPIQFYPSFVEQLKNALRVRTAKLPWANIRYRTITGAIKLLLLTPLALLWMQTALAHGNWLPFVRLGIAASVFLFYVYVSFSGYMDWMVAFGMVLGFAIPENFRQPYRAQNFLDLWNRWHITLSYTFRIYVFNPLLRVLLTYIMPDKRVLAGVVGYFIVFFLLGAWHGAELRFTYFGLILGAFAAITKFTQTLKGKSLAKLRAMDARNGHVMGASLSLGLFAMACVLTWPGWQLNDLLGLLHSGPRIAAASFVCIACALGIILFCRMAERIVRPGWVTGPAATACWLLLALILNTFLSEPLPGMLVYYQRF